MHAQNLIERENNFSTLYVEVTSRRIALLRLWMENREFSIRVQDS